MLRGFAVAGAIALLVGCALCAANAIAADTACAGAETVAVDATLGPAVESVLCLVNIERVRRGLDPVRASPELARCAQAHSRDMVARQYFSHVSPGGAGARLRALRAGYMRKRQDGRVGETITWGSEHLATPAELVRSFMQSRGHRQVLLNRHYRDVGVGLALGAPFADMPGSGATLTLDFGRR